MATYVTQGFYGSTIEGVIPQGWIDASTLREVPDHQEIYLSPKTLTSQIIEINQRVDTADALAFHTPSSSSTTPTADDIDRSAVLYHLHDLCDDTDTLNVTNPPQPVTLPNLPQARAYRGVVALTSPRKQRRGDVGQSVGGAVAGSSAEGSLTSTTSCYYLLVRLEEQETDVLVFVNVPREEFENVGDARGLAEEEKLAEGLVSGLVEKLRIVDWGLFA
ncbi:putative Ran-interacting protein Mog1 [Aspergillus steynii IBT 23096]|uniref:Putative Ran-interacting protein Mog1 n=1 Tax=Aspergillus steynii IBT 23096 TaxID=1392250 RepID=A0A2I2GBH5_9EURO|nr:putative Ran-interacting protein Mog1 [Aspergillus steynii IBT 23096]PLB50228.1 putative Ran-interacting protein Mog1 [Aspergillus steynii IBT 23096]